MRAPWCDKSAATLLSPLMSELPLLQKHKQLVKGNDDLRQDAVMQQFFRLVNELLAADAAAARRQLRIATYKVHILW